MSSDQQYPYGQGYQDPDVAQTWEGQTWDTQYQPAVHPVAYQQPQPHQQPGPPYAADSAHLPAQGAGGPGAHALPPEGPAGHPLPPEVPYDTPTAYLRPVTPGEEPAPGYDQAPAYDQAAAYEQAHAYDQAQPHAHGPAHAAAAPTPAPAPAEAAAPGYGAPTTAGHVRLTDAQRARAEGRSPIIDPGMQPAVLTAALGGLLAAGAALGPYGLLVPLVLLQAVTAAGWFRLNGMWPARQGIALAFAGGLVSDAALLAVGKEHAPAAILGTLGVWVLLVIVLQLRSHAGSDERQYGLMATVASSALAVVATGYLAAASDAVVVGGLAVAVTIVARALPLPGAATLVVALLAAAGAGAAAGGLTGMGAQGALLGLGAGVCALVGHRVAAYDYPSRFVHMTAGVALPLALAAPAVYLLGRALA
ncbi:hypothetical protein [Streptomyces lavendulocolor]|uniref:hypothetical protein n=1 Tax=Streptomyces lavendulocolor TaxID=67316 RepID=UPI003C2DC2FB